MEELQFVKAKENTAKNAASKTRIINEFFVNFTDFFINISIIKLQL